MNEVVALILLFGGSGFTLLAAIGLVRFPDLMTRMHAVAKAGTLGSGLMLLAAAVHYADVGLASRAIAAIVFIALTTPVAAHMIARAAYFLGVNLWEGSVVDELSGRYDKSTHVLEQPAPPAERISEK